MLGNLKHRMLYPVITLSAQLMSLWMVRPAARFYTHKYTQHLTTYSIHNLNISCIMIKTPLIFYLFVINDFQTIWIQKLNSLSRIMLVWQSCAVCIIMCYDIILCHYFVMWRLTSHPWMVYEQVYNKGRTWLTHCCFNLYQRSRHQRTWSDL